MTRAAREHCEGHNQSHERCRIDQIDPAQSWQGLVERVAERRAKERPWRNHPHRAGVNREIKSRRTAWAGRAVNTRRQNRRDETIRPRKWHRPPAGRERGITNVEAGWSEGWPPRMTQHDLQTLKGTKPQERMSRIDLLPRFALTHGEARRRFNRS